MGGGSTGALTQMIEKGMLGRKSGKGFFLYSGKSKDKPLNPEVGRVVYSVWNCMVADVAH
jgi:3-hydroxyacyl-CoA dehydrogenase